MQCQGVTLVPIYGHPMEKFVTRDTYTRAGADKECKTHNLTLAKAVQPTHRNTQCLKLFGYEVLSTINVQKQMNWLSDCDPYCKVLWKEGNYVRIHSNNNANMKGASTLALCEKGKTQLEPHILHHLRTDLTLLC